MAATPPPTNVSTFDYLRGNNLLNVGAMQGGELSQDAWRAESGFNGQYDWNNPAYQSWVSSHPSVAGYAADVNKNGGMNVPVFRDDGTVDIPWGITEPGLTANDGFLDGPLAPLMLLAPAAGMVMAGAGAGAFSGAAASEGMAGLGANALTDFGIANTGFGNMAASEFASLGAGAGGLPYGDAIEGLIDLTNKGLTGEQAVATLTEINPAWTQTAEQFLANNGGNYAPVENRVAPPASTAGNMPAASNFATRLTGSPGFGDLMQNMFGTGIGGGGGGVLNTMSSIGSGIDAWQRSRRQKQLAEQNAEYIRNITAGADPWGSSGGRSNAARDLMLLQSDPTSFMAKDPRFAAMIQASQRANAPAGQGSGAMAVAGAKAGGDWFSARQAELAQLAGTGNANIPGSGSVNAAQIALEGSRGADTLAGQGLASIGFGINSATGGGASAAIPALVKQWMLTQGMRV